MACVITSKVYERGFFIIVDFCSTDTEYNKVEVAEMTENQTPYEVTFENPISSIVVTRKCDCCNHHEIGIKTETGEYIQLEPGMKVTINGKIT